MIQGNSTRKHEEAAPGLFDPLDQMALARVTERLGFAFATASAPVLPAIADDDTISPVVMQAGILQAHLLGAVSIAVGIMADHAVADLDDALLAGIHDFLHTEIDKLRYGA